MTKFKIAIILTVFTSLLFISCNKRIAERKEVKQYYYSCPMHPDFISYQPGKCAKCGMTMEQWDLDNMPRKKSGGSSNGNSGIGGHSGHNH